MYEIWKQLMWYILKQSFWWGPDLLCQLSKTGIMLDSSMTSEVIDITILLPIALSFKIK